MNVYPSLIVNMFDFIGEEEENPLLFVPSIVRRYLKEVKRWIVFIY